MATSIDLRSSASASDPRNTCLQSDPGDVFRTVFEAGGAMLQIYGATPPDRQLRFRNFGESVSVPGSRNGAGPVSVVSSDETAVSRKAPAVTY